MARGNDIWTIYIVNGLMELMNELVGRDNSEPFVLEEIIAEETV